MTRKELIEKNKKEFSSLRKWAMEREYRPGSKGAVSKSGVSFAALGVVGVAASTPGYALAGTAAIASGVAPAAAAAAGGAVVLVKSADVMNRAYVEKKLFNAMFKMADKAKAIFRRAVDRMFLVPADVTRSRELAVSIAKLKFQADSIPGIAETSKDRFNPETNIYLPVSKMEKDSPVYAKNKEIFKELQRMAKAGELSPSELKEIDAFTKGATAFASGSAKYDKMVNYAVAIRKVDEIHERIANVQVQRESLKIDDAAVIEKALKREEKGRVVAKSTKEMNGELHEKIAAVKEEVESSTIENGAEPADPKPFHEMNREEYEAYFSSFAATAPEGKTLEEAVESVEPEKNNSPKLK